MSCLLTKSLCEYNFGFCSLIPSIITLFIAMKSLSVPTYFKLKTLEEKTLKITWSGLGSFHAS